MNTPDDKPDDVFYDDDKPEVSAKVTDGKPSAGRRFFAYLLIVIGIFLALFGGGCMLIMISGNGFIGVEMLGLAPLILGIGLVYFGKSMLG